MPVETLRDWYVTMCGGTSPELELHEIGINRTAIERNTSLDPDTDRVRVTVLGGVRRPVFMDPFFEVVPLDATRPGAFERSPLGEAVFPEGDEVLRSGRAPRAGQQVLINNLGRRIERLPDSEQLARIVEDVLRRGDRGDRTPL